MRNFMTSSRPCPACGTAVTESARFCPRCGTPLLGDEPEEIAISTGQRLRVSTDALSVRELMAMVEAGVFWWQRKLSDDQGVDRERAAASIKELSRILDSLSEQLAQGRETMRITTRLPAQRQYAQTCMICGRGNRASARFCIACGSPLGAEAQPAKPPSAPAPIKIMLAARTDPGMVRPNNEDTYYSGEFSTNEGVLATLLLVADGMGGAQAGEFASSQASKVVKQSLIASLAEHDMADDAAWQSALRGAAVAANQYVYEQAQADRAKTGMGTTLTIAVISDRRLHLAHVGDTRAYLINPGGVNESGSAWSQLTSDHTLVARLVDIGQLTPEQARTHPQRNILYRSLGTDPTIEVDTSSHALAPGDILLLCSDGLDGYVEDLELARIVIQEADLARACERLVDLAKERGGRDNITVLLAKIR
jgi:serine/threonine protein phosphatase PrpC